MPLTAAEKMKRYRERLKLNPEKLEEQRKRNLERIKSKYKYKKVSEMSEDEKNKKRKEWRDEKRRQKDKKTSEQTSNTASTSKGSSSRKSRINYKQKYLVAQSRIIYLHRALETMRKRLYRSQKCQMQKKKKSEAEFNKLMARNEILEASLKSTYKLCENNKERDVIKKIANNDLVKNSKAKSFISKQIGLIARVRDKTTTNRILKLKNSIIEFYIRDDVSRATSGKRECKTFKKNKQQIRFLNNSLQILYKKYKSEGGSASFASFCRYRPFYVISPNLNNRNTCLCAKHSNMSFKLAVLKHHKVIDVSNTHDLLKKVVCNIQSFACMYGKCEKCKYVSLDYNLENDKSSQEITWQMWEIQNHTYKKRTKDGDEQELKTKRTVKSIKKGTITELIKIFEESLSLFKVHSFNMWHQTKNYKTCTENLDDHEMAVHCDFSENFECKMAEEVQAMHFGASKVQVTLHTGVIFCKGGQKSFCTVSPSSIHQPHAIWAHLKPIIELGKSLVPNLKKIYFFSDGPSTQYRQKNNFFLIKYFSSFYKVDISWSFFESGHGKGVADAIGGVVKRALDRQIAYGKDIISATDVYLTLESFVKAVKVFYVSETEINGISQLIPAGLKTIKGTMSIHEVISVQGSDEIRHRILSCFCSKKICCCYDLETHKYPNFSHVNNHESENNEPTDNQPLLPKLNELPILDTEIVDDLPILCIDNVDLEDNIASENNAAENRIDVIIDLSDIYSNSIIGAIDSANVLPVLSNISKANNVAQDFDEMKIKNHAHKLMTRKENVTPNISSKVIDPYSSTSKDPYPATSKLSRDPVKNSKLNTYTRNPAKKSLQIPVTRQMACNKCKNPTSLHYLVKCMSCKKYYCDKCAQGQVYFDYICDFCFEGC